MVSNGWFKTNECQHIMLTAVMLLLIVVTDKFTFIFLMYKEIVRSVLINKKTLFLKKKKSNLTLKIKG